MSKIRRMFAGLVAIVLAATAVGALAKGVSHHHPAVHNAALRHSVAPAPMAQQAAPSADFDTETFLAVLSKVEPSIAPQLIAAMSPADRAAIGADVEIHTGLSAG